MFRLQIRLADYFSRPVLRPPSVPSSLGLYCLSHIISSTSFILTCARWTHPSSTPPHHPITLNWLDLSGFQRRLLICIQDQKDRPGSSTEQPCFQRTVGLACVWMNQSWNNKAAVSCRARSRFSLFRPLVFQRVTSATSWRWCLVKVSRLRHEPLVRRQHLFSLTHLHPDDR